MYKWKNNGFIKEVDEVIYKRVIVNIEKISISPINNTHKTNGLPL